EVVHLRTSLSAVERAGLKWVFTDGHAAILLSRFFNQKSDLSRLDWELMHQTYWNNTDDDGDRTRRRQAEFLIYQFAPWELVNGIGAMTQEAAKAVRTVLAKATHQPSVKVLPEWYF